MRNTVSVFIATPNSDLDSLEDRITAMFGVGTDVAVLTVKKSYIGTDGLGNLRLRFAEAFDNHVKLIYIDDIFLEFSIAPNFCPNGGDYGYVEAAELFLPYIKFFISYEKIVFVSENFDLLNCRKNDIKNLLKYDFSSNKVQAAGFRNPNPDLLIKGIDDDFATSKYANLSWRGIRGDTIPVDTRFLVINNALFQTTMRSNSTRVNVEALYSILNMQRAIVFKNYVDSIINLAYSFSLVEKEKPVKKDKQKHKPKTKNPKVRKNARTSNEP